MCIKQANEWCSNGSDILAAQKLETCATCELAEKYLQNIQQFVLSANSFTGLTVTQSKNEIGDSLTSEIQSHATQIKQKIEDVLHMCEKRIVDLKHLGTLYHRRTHTYLSELPKQPTGGAPYLNKAVLRKVNTISKMENPSEGEDQEFCNRSSLTESDSCHNEEYRAKRGHVLTELLETEKVYVAELLSIIRGYKLEAQSEEMQPILPPGLISKLDIIFGNLDEIYAFHAGIFLKDLENCISSADLVALCFVQRRDSFYRLYSYYCQNIPRSEQIRETLVGANAFFQTCQRKLDHKLPLAAYLLKPVQRITKYQLLLKDLLKYCVDGKFNKELEQALECMLIVLKCVNDSMHQISITGFPLDLSRQGDLLLQGSFSVWVENKRDLRLRLKPMQRHIFLYQKAILFCKPASKTAHNKATYHFKHCLEMSQIGLTESVKGDTKKFEVWLKGRQEVYTIQAVSLEQKQAWVNEIKRVLLSQLEELKGEKIKQYSTHAHKQLRQTTSWDAEQSMSNNLHISNHRTVSCEMQHNATVDYDPLECIEGGNWSSDCSNSDDEDQVNTAKTSCRYVALADYCAVGNSEVSMREGDMVELLKVGCAGWWFVKVIGSAVEGWAPAAYLENLHHKPLRSSNHSQDRLNDH